MSGEFFTDFKSSNGIEISSLVPSVIEFLLILGVPWGWQMGGGISVCVCGGVSMLTMFSMHTWMLNIVSMLNMDASMSAAICNFYTCINVCVCMHVHLGTPQMPPHLPPPQSCRGPKTPKFNKS